MARERFPTTLEYSPYRLAIGKGGGAYVTVGTLRGTPANLVPRTVGSVPNPRTSGNFLGKLSLRGQPTVCLGLPCKVSINRLSASHCYPRLLSQLAMISHNNGTRGILLYELIACQILD
jgi:hypothetical protein